MRPGRGPGRPQDGSLNSCLRYISTLRRPLDEMCLDIIFSTYVCLCMYVCMSACLSVACRFLSETLFAFYSKQVKFQSYICKVLCALIGIAWKSSDSTSASRAGRETGLCNAYSITSGV